MTEPGSAPCSCPKRRVRQLQLRPFRASGMSRPSPAMAASPRRQGTALVVAATCAALAFVLLRPQGPAPTDTKAADDSLRVQAVSRYEPPLPPATPNLIADH